ncbi:MAG: hypothetical protein ACI8P5_000403 [Bacteroidia bacterium]|jgi:hypothetical protein
MFVRRITNFIVLAGLKVLARTFYSIENKWLHNHDDDPWGNVKLIAFFNHTSLFEPLFDGAVPWRVLWQIAGRIVVPGAAVTLDRPIAGWLFSFIAPQIVPVSRERDETWDNFLDAIAPESVVMIMPEGRMKRPNGLDKHGNAMSVRGGVADILEMLPSGEMVMMYSGGLHHVQTPGQGFPKLFKRIQIQCERVNIQEYVHAMKAVPNASFKKAVISDMEARMERNIPVNSWK